MPRYSRRRSGTYPPDPPSLRSTVEAWPKRPGRSSGCRPPLKVEFPTSEDRILQNGRPSAKKDACRHTCMHLACMCVGARYAFEMKTIQIRNVSDELHRTLKVRAAQDGVSLSELALEELKRLATRPSRSVLLKRIAERQLGTPSTSPTEMSERSATRVDHRRSVRHLGAPVATRPVRSWPTG